MPKESGQSSKRRSAPDPVPFDEKGASDETGMSGMSGTFGEKWASGEKGTGTASMRPPGAVRGTQRVLPSDRALSIIGDVSGSPFTPMKQKTDRASFQKLSAKRISAICLPAEAASANGICIRCFIKIPRKVFLSILWISYLIFAQAAGCKVFGVDKICW